MTREGKYNRREEEKRDFQYFPHQQSENHLFPPLIVLLPKIPQPILDLSESGPTT
jgi:hypothetical protein